MNKFVLAAVQAVLFAGCATTQLGVVMPDRATIKLSHQVYEILAGEIALEQGDTENALRHYRRAAGLSGEAEIFSSALAIAMRGGHYREAAQIGEQWRRLEPDRLALHQAMVIVHIKLEQYDKALPHIEFAIDHSDGIFDHEGYRPIAAHLDDSIDSFGIINKMLTLYPNNAKLHFLHAMAALHFGRYDIAYEAAGYAVSLNAAFVKAQAAVADALFGLGRIEEGLDLLHTQAQLYPQHERLWLKAARAFFLHDRDRLALDFYRQIYPRNKTEREVVYALGVLHLRAERLDEARRFFSELAELVANNKTETDRAVYYLGRVDEAAGDYEAAAAQYGRVGAGPLFHEARIGLARLHGKGGRLDLLAAEFESAHAQTRSDRAKIALFIAQAEMMHELAPVEQVLEVYRRALAQYKDEPNLLYSRAMFASDIMRLDLVERDLKRIVKIDPDNWRALNALGYLLADNNTKLEEARQYVRRAYDLQPNNPAILDSVGWVEFRLNNLPGAERFIQQAADMQNHPEILGHLVEVLWSRQKKQAALAVIKRALAEFPDNEYLQKLHLKIK